MKSIPILLRPLSVVLATGIMLTANYAFSFDAIALADAQDRYRQELIVCNIGPTAQDRVNCRQEARRVLSEARSSILMRAEQLEQQAALRRCAGLRAVDRLTCEEQARNPGAMLRATPANTMPPERASVHAPERYRQEMAACNIALSVEDRSACRQDAQVAYAEAMRGGLNDVPGQYDANELRRCEPLTGSDRRDCESRTRGEGKVSGTVQGGAILRETTTIVPGKTN